MDTVLLDSGLHLGTIQVRNQPTNSAAPLLRAAQAQTEGDYRKHGGWGMSRLVEAILKWISARLPLRDVVFMANQRFPELSELRSQMSGT